MSNAHLSTAASLILLTLAWAAPGLSAADGENQSNPQRHGRKDCRLGERLDQMEERLGKRIERINERLAKHPDAPEEIKTLANKLLANLKEAQADVAKTEADLKARNKEELQADKAELKEDHQQIKETRQELKAAICAWKKSRHEGRAANKR